MPFPCPPAGDDLAQVLCAATPDYGAARSEAPLAGPGFERTRLRRVPVSLRRHIKWRLHDPPPDAGSPGACSRAPQRAESEPPRRFESSRTCSVAGADTPGRDSNCAWLRQSPVSLRGDRGSDSASEQSEEREDSAGRCPLVGGWRLHDPPSDAGSPAPQCAESEPPRRFESSRLCPVFGVDSPGRDSNCAWLCQSPVSLRRAIKARLGRSHSEVRILSARRVEAPEKGTRMGPVFW